jgi:two-component system, cell cycle sensor histidine kinase and response regulator CckA
MIRPVPELLKLAPAQVGYRVTAAVNGPAAPALRPAIRDEIRLLLTDLVTPDGLTGRDLARGLLADRADLPVLFLSGYSADLAEMELGGASATNFLPKPFIIWKPRAAIRRVLDTPRRPAGAQPEGG